VRARLRALGLVLAVSVVLAAGVAVVGGLLARWRDASVRDTVGYALCLAGALVVVAAGSLRGIAGDAGVEKVYRRAPKQAPLGWLLVGLVLMAAGVLVFALG
jgi:membrane protease YdiL (CAAX protease family)